MAHDAAPDRAESGIGSALHDRARHYMQGRRAGGARLLASEHVSAFIVSLPRSGTRQRGALVTYAVEETVAQPIDSVTVRQAPLKGAGPTQVLALVCSRAVLERFGADTTRLLPDFLLIPRPDAAEAPAAWAVWRDGARAVVRADDGTGFAAPVAALPLLWAHAGKPALTSLGMALPPEMPAQDISQSPPAPDPGDLAFGFGQAGRDRVETRRIAALAGGAVAVALLAHLAILAADTLALRRTAAQTQAAAQSAIAAPLPGLTVTRDVAPVLARLAPPEAGSPRGAFLPLLEDIATALAAGDTKVEFRRLAWGTGDRRLTALMQSDGLDDLQAVQRTLESAGLEVQSGAASAGEGAAEAELRISRGGGA